MPGGQLLGWQPGKTPSVAAKGLAWILNKNTDLVLQLHMHPTGKPETIQPSVGFYFTDEPPTNICFRINLTYLPIDIPAGVKDYAVEESYTLPVDVEVMAVSPHAHYLGKQLEGYAILPDRTRKRLLLIKDWDFNWQGDYRYAKPVFLPRGTTLAMHFSYDNSAENARNPTQPPRRVKYGLQTTDEMGELFFQVLPGNAQERNILADDFSRKLAQYTIDYNEYLLRTNPNDAVAHTKVGRALVYLGRVADGLEHLHSAVKADPDYDKAHYELGFVFLRQNLVPDAKSEFETVIRLNPEDYQAHGSLGSIWLRLGRLEEAESCFRTALRINPDDVVAQKNLERLLKTKATLKRANGPR
jgi:tetratricopeptide (TPR) repeat protein